MFDLDCPICLNSFSFEHIRSLPCGHTYCSSCVEKLIDDSDETSTCPECRNDFEFEDIRPLYLKPSNHTSGSQTSSRHDSTSDQDGYIKQAKHIARRLQTLNTKSPAESVKNAADVIEQVATIQCKAAQEIIWKAVRAFWMNLVTDFERLDEHEDFRAQISRFQAKTTSLEQRMDTLDDRCSRLGLKVEKERDRAQQYLAVIEDKTREIDKLTVALRTADDEASQERERQHVIIARLRASDIKRRAQIKQLQLELRSRKADGPKTQLEDESLIVEPGEAYNKARSHRLDIYDENVSSSKRCKLLPEVNPFASPGESSDHDHWPSTSATPPTETEFRVQPQERTGTGLTHQPTARPESDLLVPPSPQRPKFGSDWNVLRRVQRRKSTGKSSSATLPFPLDTQGRPKGLLTYGPRVRMKVKK